MAVPTNTNTHDFLADSIESFLDLVDSIESFLDFANGTTCGDLPHVQKIGKNAIHLQSISKPSTINTHDFLVVR